MQEEYFATYLYIQDNHKTPMLISRSIHMSNVCLTQTLHVHMRISSRWELIHSAISNRMYSSVCMYMCTHTFTQSMHMQTQVRTDTNMQTQIQTYTNMQTRIRTDINMQTQIRTGRHKYETQISPRWESVRPRASEREIAVQHCKYAYMCVFVCIHIYIHIHIYMYTYGVQRQKRNFEFSTVYMHACVYVCVCVQCILEYTVRRETSKSSTVYWRDSVKTFALAISSVKACKHPTGVLSTWLKPVSTPPASSQLG